ncbi:MAG: GMC oxidoreductase [Nostoc sp.]|uniref:GMC oxidoreductase n=1 Tax=Nostoc sp. TaxID=1180 RepID=UPI002FF6223A
MSRLIKRRHFLQASLAATTSIGISAIRGSAFNSEEYVEAIVIGSGFGGAVASLRLGQAKIETIVLERGRRWPITDAGNTFATFEKPDGRTTWLSPTTVLRGFDPDPIDIYTGVLDAKVGNGVTAYRGAGVGGSSLVYSAVTYQPNREIFYKAFPRSINYEELDKVYYPRVRSILKPAPIPDNILQTDYYLASRIFMEQGAKAGLKVRKHSMAVNWDIVRQEITAQKVPSAINGVLIYGANSGAKNSLDKNYLKMAEATGHVEIRSLHVVTRIEELNNGRFRIVCNQINEQGMIVGQKSLICRYLFLAAGSIGTTELLLRAKVNGTLRRLNRYVGQFWGTNGDALSAVINKYPTNPSQGGPATSVIEHFDNPIAPVIIEQTPLPNLQNGVIASLGQAIAKPEGYFTYNTSTQSADLFWPSNSANNQKNSQALQYTYKLLDRANDTTIAGKPDSGLTTHPLGGAVMEKVCNTYGQVYGYPNLFVVDGSMIPGSAGANPSLTIAALAERCMDKFLLHRIR